MNQVDNPQPGFYKLHKVRGGVWVPVWIVRMCQCTIHGPERHECQDDCDRFPPLTAFVDQRESNPFDIWSYCCGSPIEQTEYEFMIADAKWCRSNLPNDPKANPEEKIDPNTLTPMF